MQTGLRYDGCRNAELCAFCDAGWVTPSARVTGYVARGSYFPIKDDTVFHTEIEHLKSLVAELQRTSELQAKRNVELNRELNVAQQNCSTLQDTIAREFGCELLSVANPLHQRLKDRRDAIEALIEERDGLKADVLYLSRIRANQSDMIKEQSTRIDKAQQALQN